MLKISVALVLSASYALAQAGGGGAPKQVLHMRDGGELGPPSITTMLAGPMGTVTGAPYSAQALTQRIQTLADGNRIEQSSTGSVARDSQGRVRRDEALPSLEDGNGESAHIVMIDDPVSQVHWTLDALTKTAIKMVSPQGFGNGPGLMGSMPPPISDKRTFFYSTSTGGPSGSVTTNKQQIFISKVPPGPDPNVTQTDLGTQTIEGVMAQGTRYVRTIPAKQAGNELPLVITTEKWYSPELKVLIMSKSSDPRMGDTIYKLTGLQRAEPAASLFQPPDDYAVRDGPQNQLFFREKK